MAGGKVMKGGAGEGAEGAVGAEGVEVETEKITGFVESPASGVMRRQVAQAGQDVPVGGLLAVLADATVDDDQITAFIEGFSPCRGGETIHETYKWRSVEAKDGDRTRSIVRLTVETSYFP